MPFGTWLPASDLASLLLVAHLVDDFCLSCMDLPWLDPASAGRGSVVCTGTWSGSGWVWDRRSLLLPIAGACGLLWAGCCEAALSRCHPARFIFQSGVRQLMLLISLGLCKPRLPPAVGEHWCPQPLAHLSPSTLSHLLSTHWLPCSPQDGACFARDISLPKAWCLVLGPSLSQHFPRFLLLSLRSRAAVLCLLPISVFC